MGYRLKHYKLRLRRLYRKLETQYRHHKVVLPVTAALVLVVIGITLVVALRDSDVIARERFDGTNIVILHVDDEDKVLPTKEETVEGLLKNAGIELKEGDVVEPAIDTPILEDDFRVNVYRAAPVVIQDEETRVQTMSAAQTSRSIADQAGIEVHPEDEIVTEPSRDFLRDGIGSKVTINRSTPVTLNLYGTSLSMRTHAETVGDLLEEKNVVLETDDTVKPALSTPLTENTQVFVTRFGVEVVTVEEEIAMPVETVDDNSLSYGTTAVRQAGAPGVRSVTYQLQFENGVEVGRTAIQEVTVREPVKQIVVRGTSGKFENFNSDGIPARVFCGSPHQNNWKNINTYNAGLGRAMAASKGWTGAQFNALLELWACESSWTHTAGNPYSGAYGIPQALPASKMGDTSACGGAGYLTDPQIQIAWGMCYIERRYGTPIGALDKHYRSNWY